MTNQIMKLKFLLLITFLLTILFVSTPAQQSASSSTANAPTSVVKTFLLDSELMTRQISYNVIFPPAYETEKQARFPVLYLLHGTGGSNKSWGQNQKLIESSAQHRIIIVTPDGARGFYTDSASVPNDKYESYIIQELIPEIDKNFRTISNRKGRAVAGNSMGGYGALKFGVKYPDKFVLAASMSGAVRTASWRKPEDLTSPPTIKNTLISIFGEKNTEKLEANDLFKIFKEFPNEKIASLPFLYLDCGTEDEFGFLPFNQELAQILVTQKIPHEFRQLPGKHNGQLWSEQIREILRLSERIFLK